MSVSNRNAFSVSLCTICYRWFTRRSALTLIGLALWFGLQGQDRVWPYVDLNFNGQLGFPQGGFREELPRAGSGFSGSLLVQIRPLPLLGGVEMGGQWYDREKVRYSAYVDGRDRDYRLVTRNHIFLAHVVMRFQPVVSAFIWPYLDGLFGLKHLYTRTTLVEIEDVATQTFIEGDIDKKDTALSFGAAAGFQLRPFNHPAVRLDVRCLYLAGPNAAYLVRDKTLTGPFDDPIEAFKEVNSPTSILIPQIGITVDLSRLWTAENQESEPTTEQE